MRRYQPGGGPVWRHESPRQKALFRVQIWFWMLNRAFKILSRAQLDHAPKSRAWGKSLCMGVIFWEVRSYYEIGKLRRMKQGRRRSQARGACCCGQLKLGLEEAGSTSELFSREIKEGTIGMPREILPPSHLHVCLGLKGWVHSIGISGRSGKEARAGSKK